MAVVSESFALFCNADDMALGGVPASGPEGVAGFGKVALGGGVAVEFP